MPASPVSFHQAALPS